MTKLHCEHNQLNGAFFHALSEQMYKTPSDLHGQKMHILLVLNFYRSSLSPTEHSPELLLLDGRSEDEQFKQRQC